MVRNSNSSSLILDEDLSKILQKGQKWKMLLNLDASKRSPGDCFLTQKNLPLKKSTQKYLGIYLDLNLNFFEHINEKIKKKAVKGISLIKKT